MSERTAEDLRRDFDRSFRAQRSVPERAAEDYLAVEIGVDPFAIRIADIAGVYADRRVVSIPSPRAEMLGLARFKSALVPVFDLRVLLGYPAEDAPRWMVVVHAPAIFGLAFDRFVGHVGGELAGETLNTDGVLRPLLAVGELAERLRKER